MCIRKEQFLTRRRWIRWTNRSHSFLIFIIPGKLEDLNERICLDKKKKVKRNPFVALFLPSYDLILGHIATVNRESNLKMLREPLITKKKSLISFCRVTALLAKPASSSQVLKLYFGQTSLFCSVLWGRFT